MRTRDTDSTLEATQALLVTAWPVATTMAISSAHGTGTMTILLEQTVASIGNQDGAWFNACFNALLNGEYFTGPKANKTWQGIIWKDWLGSRCHPC